MLVNWRDYKIFEDVVKIVDYPSGELHAQLLEDTGSGITIIEAASVRDWNDLMTVYALDKRLKQLGKEVLWFIPYLPFARDDRRRTGGCANELDVAIQLLKEMNNVIIADPHSYVSEILPHIGQKDLVDIVFTRTDVAEIERGQKLLIVVPDEGATKKAFEWAPDYVVDVNDIVIAGKTRDPHTGKLSNFRLPERDDYKNAVALIYDDICDGGGTFLGLGAELKKRGVTDLRLAVTHGLFTNGYANLTDMFSQIVTFGCSPFADFPAVETNGGVTQIPWRYAINCPVR